MRSCERLRALPNVEAVGAKSLFSTRIYVGARRQRAMVIGVADFARQDVDVVTPLSGSAPAAGTVLTDNQNAPKGKFEGTTVRVVAADGSVRALPVAGEARNLVRRLARRRPRTSPTFYTSPETVAQLSGSRGYNWFGLRLRDASAAGRRPHGRGRARRAARGARASTASPSCPQSASPASTRARRCSSRSRAS